MVAMIEQYLDGTQVVLLRGDGWQSDVAGPACLCMHACPLTLSRAPDLAEKLYFHPMDIDCPIGQSSIRRVMSGAGTGFKSSTVSIRLWKPKPRKPAAASSWSKTLQMPALSLYRPSHGLPRCRYQVGNVRNAPNSLLKK